MDGCQCGASEKRLLSIFGVYEHGWVQLQLGVIVSSSEKLFSIRQVCVCSLFSTRSEGIFPSFLHNP